MKGAAEHFREVEQIQSQIRQLYLQRQATGAHSSEPVNLNYRTSSSYTIRSKSYKKAGSSLDCSHLNQIIEIDRKRMIAKVEPRITMQALQQQLAKQQLTMVVVPELKQITIGGAVMGVGAESASHRYGCFNDTCVGYELLAADGHLLHLSATENADLFYALPGSYGSLGALTAIEVQLQPAKESVLLRYRAFSRPASALRAMSERLGAPDAPDFIDGIIFNKDLAVIVEGTMTAAASLTSLVPKFSAEHFYAKLYFQHLQQIASNHIDGEYREQMALSDYFFRYDPGAFWMGAYLFHLPLLSRLLLQGVLKWWKAPEGLTPDELQRFQRLSPPNMATRVLMRSFASCQLLCRLLHCAESWVQNRFIIQDFCLPESKAQTFLTTIESEPAIFPLWLLPIKGTAEPQLFAPHLLPRGQPQGYFINFGLYGLPATATPIVQLTRQLERQVFELGGRKVLYGRSYYTLNEFWQIYPYADYAALRKKTLADGFWHDIAAKVLSA
jgi:hypothetical protein